MLSTRTLALVSVLLLGTVATSGRAADEAKGRPQTAPVPARDAAAKMTVPEGFSVKLFAAEPDVRQPIAITIDHRGRLWVAESFSYPNWLQKAVENDRILILEDRDGDGRLDHRTVFWDKGGKISNISGLTVGFGGAWVCATPNLMFIPDRDGDDIPDGEPEVVLDGWDVNARHNLFNGLTWGPDGWLYGLNGILSNSRVGRPGTPDAKRVPINCGVWRYHPTKQRFEDVAHGTTNPWGLDFDDYGEAFITNCVIPHLFRVVPGSHFQRMFGPDMNPNSYGLLESCADHIHWAGGHWTDSRGGKGKHGEAGGGHAHTGAMVYLGDNWPDRYRNSIFMCNIHGHRVNHDWLERSGSGYVAKHGKDFLFANDEWFRGMELRYGPDGAVYMTDWSDTGECHETDGDLAHRENGRIFKVTFGTPKPVTVDLSRLDDAELVQLQLHKNDWYVRNARRLLQERAAKGKPMGAVHEGLRAQFEKDPEVTRKLRALWTLHATGGLTPEFLAAQLNHPSEYVRNWAVRLLVDDGQPSGAALAKFAAMAKEDASPLVRLALAAALQRIAPGHRWEIAEGLVAHGEDARDASLPLMTWYGIEPLVAEDAPRAIALAGRIRIPVVRQFLARRAVQEDDKGNGAVSRIALLLRQIGKMDDPASQKDLLSGAYEALRGHKGLSIPEGWPEAFEALRKSPDPAVREQTLMLGLLFDAPQALAVLKATMMDPSTSVDARRRALQSLVEKRVPGLAASLRALVDDRAMRGPALRGLAAYDDPATPATILSHYAALTPEERADAINTLASRVPFALALLDAVKAGKVSPRDLNAATARQLQAFGDKRISQTLQKVWGTLRPTSREKTALIAKYKGMLTPDRMKSADLARGRLLFNNACLQCHRLYDAGGDVGPDLTGSDRANTDYILENVLDPSATVGRDYRLTNVAMIDGRLLSGIVREQTDKTLVIQTVNERLVLPREDVEEMKPSDASMMPEGALEKLSPDEVRDLVGYLASKSQVPLPAPASGR